MINFPKFSDTAEDTVTNMNRRALLTNALRLAFAAAVVHSTGARAELCADPDELSGTDYSFRKYVEYTEAYSDPNNACGKCAFFKAGQGECGTCQVVAGSINSHGHCTSWSAHTQK